MRPSIVCAMLVIGLTTAGCTDMDETNESMTEVDVDDSYFQVKGKASTRNGETTGKVGEMMHFKNDGALPHTVTVHRPPDPASTTLLNVTLNPGMDTSLTFDKAGTYHIWCRFHGAMTSGMRLTVNVA